MRSDKRKNQTNETNILIRNSLQTDEETNHIGLDSSFDEEINDESSVCLENNNQNDNMETQIRNGNLDGNHRLIKTLKPKEEQR